MERQHAGNTAGKSKSCKKSYIKQIYCSTAAKDRADGMAVGQFTWCKKLSKWLCVHKRRVGGTRCAICCNIFCKAHEKFRRSCNACKDSVIGTCRAHTARNGCQACSTARLKVSSVPSQTRNDTTHNNTLFATKKKKQLQQRKKICEVHRHICEACEACNNKDNVIQGAFCAPCLQIVKFDCTECKTVRERLKEGQASCPLPARI